MGAGHCTRKLTLEVDRFMGGRSPGPSPGASRRGCAPVPNPVLGRGLSERSEFRSPKLRDQGKGTPLGPPPGAHGFGSFCRNKRTSSRGAETSREPSPSIIPDPIGDPVSLVFAVEPAAVLPLPRPEKYSGWSNRRPGPCGLQKRGSQLSHTTHCRRNSERLDCCRESEAV